MLKLCNFAYKIALILVKNRLKSLRLKSLRLKSLRLKSLSLKSIRPATNIIAGLKLKLL